MKVAIGCDHRGYKKKGEIIQSLLSLNCEIFDVGCHDEKSCDYPDIAVALGEFVPNEVERGILICQTGIGMSIAANKLPRIRAVLATRPGDAELGRLHNNANVMCLPAIGLFSHEYERMLKAFLTTATSGDERHKRRIEKIKALENYGSCN